MQVSVSQKVVTREELLADLEQIRQQGFSIGRSERFVGVASVAAPVTGADGSTVAIVCVTGAAERMPAGVIQRLAVEVRRASQALSETYTHG